MNIFIKYQENHLFFGKFLSENYFRNPLRILLLSGLFLINISYNSIYAQKTKKDKVRLNVQYVKIMDGDIYFNIKASARIKKKTVKVSNIDLFVYNELENVNIKLGKTTTDSEGESKFSLKNISDIQPDSTSMYHILVSFKGNDAFKKAKKSIHFKDADIHTKIITKDSIHYISASLVDTETKEPIVDESLSVYVQRLFKSLRIGEEFNSTDADGSILVPIENGIPGVNGNLTLEVILNESDDYGTIKSLTAGSVGIPISDESTYDQRTMWSPRNKTPVFLLIFPNLLIFAVWGIIIYLIINLFKLSKS